MFVFAFAFTFVSVFAFVCVCVFAFVSVFGFESVFAFASVFGFLSVSFFMLLDAVQSLTKEVLAGHTWSIRFGKKSACVIVFVFVSVFVTVFLSVILSFYCEWTRDHPCPRSPGGAAGHTWSTRLGEESACVRQEFDGEETPRQPLTAKVWDFWNPYFKMPQIPLHFQGNTSCTLWQIQIWEE